MDILISLAKQMDSGQPDDEPSHRNDRMYVYVKC